MLQLMVSFLIIQETNSFLDWTVIGGMQTSIDV